eukprot:scaffold66767_cov15-Tisochrysis_lutea.AAC.2
MLTTEHLIRTWSNNDYAECIGQGRGNIGVEGISCNLGVELGKHQHHLCSCMQHGFLNNTQVGLNRTGDAQQQFVQLSHQGTTNQPLLK